MAMTILNNTAAALTLGELNKNISEVGKQLKKISQGQRITGAGEGASEYAISERMRVRIRALEQDDRNVQNGKAMLRVAEGAVQQQLDIMKTIKAKVIDADNDSNTDLDRITIQKEITQGFTHINDIAYETNYNNKLLLVGSKKVGEVRVWKVLDEAGKVENSDSLKLIWDASHSKLDEIEGPFSTLPFYSETEATAEPLLGPQTRVNLSGGAAGYYEDPQDATPSKFTMDFSGYTSANAEGVGFYITGNKNSSSDGYRQYYVLTNNPGGKSYRHGDVTSENVTEINVSDCATADAIASRVASTIAGGRYVGTASADGSTITVTTAGTGSATANVSAGGWAQSGDTTQRVTGGGASQQYGRSSAAATGLGNSSASGTDGKSGTYVPPTYKTVVDPITDMATQVVDVPGHYEGEVVPGEKARIRMDVGNVEAGSGFAIQGQGGTAYVRFVEGSTVKRDSTGVYEVGIDANVTDYTLCTWNTFNPTNSSDSYVRLSMKDGKMDLASFYTGSSATIRVTDGFSSVPPADAIPPTTVSVTFDSVTSYGGAVQQTETGIDRGPYHPGPTASYTMDLSAYDSTAGDVMESFIDALKGKGITTSYGTVEFIDTKVPSSMDAIKHFPSGGSMDLNALRSDVAGGTTVAQAFIDRMKGLRGYSDTSDGSGKKLTVTAARAEAAGNSETISIQQGNMSAYNIDFKKVLQDNPGLDIPDSFDGKGFRVYCATCKDQWFNFQFTTVPEEILTRPDSGSSGADLRTTMIDISGATDMESLVQTIYEQGSEAMEHIMDGHSHMLHMKADPKGGIITVYDDRMFDLRKYRNRYPNLQEMGAKIGDGLVDDVELVKRDICVNDLVIHDTDHASMNIHLRIPQTSMDHLFNYIPGLKEMSDFNVLTAENREMLLGNQGGRRTRDGSRYVSEDERGLVDRAIEYLTDANTLIGAQINRLDASRENIIINGESTTASESTIRDADMAQEMAKYTRANVLLQASQSMLAQANQTAGSVLSLLQ